MATAMLTLFHAPFSRSSAVMSLIDEIGIADEIAVQIVDIRRQDGSGRFDPANPHPEHKAPALLVGDSLMTERGAIMLYLTAAIRDHAAGAARLRAALDNGRWRLGESFSAADILCSGPYHWFKDAVPDAALIRDGVVRGAAQPASVRGRAADAALMAARAA